MATREVKSLSAPAIYLDGLRLKILPNSCKCEMPGEVKSRAVSAGGGAYDIVHGVDIEANVCSVKFEVANTAEMVDLVRDYVARRGRVEVSTLRAVEDTVQLTYDRVLLTNKVEVPFDAEGSIEMEFMGRYAAV